MKADLATKYDLRVPRYTSYPTAPHFNEAVDGEAYRKWLGELGPEHDLSLYFHIPFCDSMCWFCGCYTKIVQRYEPVAQYLDVILDEIDLVADALPQRLRATHLHWGGGSPTMLKGPDWMKIANKIRSRFDVTDTAEVAVELDPRDATEDYIEALAAAGVNRASIGVQDFHPEVQEAINRIQPFDVTKRVIDWLRKHGIQHVNMDLIYGLPHQSTERVLDMVDKTLSFEPARVALFGYAHVPWMKSHQKMIKEEDLPGTEERWEQFTLASDKLVDAGYVRIGLDHYAKPGDSLADALASGKMHRNFQGYTSDMAPVLIGMGASSIGSLPQGFVQNTQPLKQYRETIAAGNFPIARGVAFTQEDKLRAAVIERIMCDMKVDLPGLLSTQGFAPDHFAAELDALAPLADDGICTLENGVVSIPEDARPFMRLVAATFDAYLKKGEQRHSKAV